MTDEPLEENVQESTSRLHLPTRVLFENRNADDQLASEDWNCQQKRLETSRGGFCCSESTWRRIDEHMVAVKMLQKSSDESLLKLKSSNTVGGIWQRVDHHLAAFDLLKKRAETLQLVYQTLIDSPGNPDSNSDELEELLQLVDEYRRASEPFRESTETTGNKSNSGGSHVQRADKHLLASDLLKQRADALQLMSQSLMVTPGSKDETSASLVQCIDGHPVAFDLLKKRAAALHLVYQTMVDSPGNQALSSKEENTSLVQGTDEYRAAIELLQKRADVLQLVYQNVMDTRRNQNSNSECVLGLLQLADEYKAAFEPFRKRCEAMKTTGNVKNIEL